MVVVATIPTLMTTNALARSLLPPAGITMPRWAEGVVREARRWPLAAKWTFNWLRVAFRSFGLLEGLLRLPRRWEFASLWRCRPRSVWISD